MREKILTFIEKNSRVDLKDLAVFSSHKQDRRWLIFAVTFALFVWPGAPLGSHSQGWRWLTTQKTSTLSV